MAPLSLVGAVVQSTLMAQKRGRTDSSIKGDGGKVKKEEEEHEQSGEEPTGERGVAQQCTGERGVARQCTGARGVARQCTGARGVA